MTRELLSPLYAADKYGYAEKDIVVMLDSETVQNYKLRPTRDNIVCDFLIYVRYNVLTIKLSIKLRQIDKLVKGAEAGDHFFFHCT